METVHTSLYKDGTPEKTLATLNARLKEKYGESYTCTQNANVLDIILPEWNTSDRDFFQTLYDDELIDTWRILQK